MRNMKLQYVIVTMLFLLVYSCGANCTLHAETREEFHKKYTVESGTPLSVKNVNGSINVSTWNKDYVDVFAVKKSRKGKDDLDKVEIRVSTDGRLNIEAHRLTKRDHVSVSFTIKVPGDVVVDKIRTTNGSVKLEGTTGDSYVTSTNGSIEVDNADGIIELRTTNGNIRLYDVTGVKCATSTNGSIKVSLNELENDVDITTTNGSIEVHIPRDIDADIDFRTTNGRIKAGGLKMRIDEISKKRINGEIGSGGNRLNVRTINGGITIHTL